MRRRTRRPETRTCLVAGCGTVIAGWKWLCDRHFKALPFPERQAIAQAGQDRAPHRVSALCIAGAKALAAREAATSTAAADRTARMLGERIDG